MKKVVKTFQYGDHTVTFETGEIARQASGAIIASMGDTVVHVTVVGRKDTESLKRAAPGFTRVVGLWSPPAPPPMPAMQGMPPQNMPPKAQPWTLSVSVPLSAIVES